MIEKLIRGEGFFAKFVCVFFALALAVSLTPVLPYAAFAAEGEQAGQDSGTDPPAVQMLTISTQDATVNGGSQIDTDGTYTLAENATGTITVGENIAVTVKGASFVDGVYKDVKYDELYFVVGSGSTLTLENVYINNGANVKPAVDFAASGAFNIEGTNIIDEIGNGGSPYGVVHAAGGSDNTVTLGGTGTLYAYKDSGAALIGSNKDDDGTDPCANIVFNGGTWNLKGNRTGAIVGNDMAASGMGAITVNGGELHLKAVARGACLGGSAAGYAADVAINGGLVECFSDFDGSAVGGAVAGKGVASAGFGALTVAGGSLKTVFSLNVASMSKAAYGFSDEEWNAASANNTRAFISEKTITAANDRALLVFDMGAYADQPTVTVNVDDAPFYSGAPAYSYVIDEVKSPSGLTSVNFMANTAASALAETEISGQVDGSSFAPDANLYFWLTKANHTLTVGADTYNVTWDADAAAFTCEKAEPAPAYDWASTTWAGGLDFSWYDENDVQSEYHLTTPAQWEALAWICSEHLAQLAEIGEGTFTNGNVVAVNGTVPANQNVFAGVKFYLDNDIDMGGAYDAATDTWSGFNYYPIGSQGANDNGDGNWFGKFYGSFDGQGHYVNNVCADRGSGQSYQAVGLFGRVGAPDGEPAPEVDIVIENIGVSGYIKSGRSVSGIVGKTLHVASGKSITIRDCANRATVRSTDKKGVGGVVGALWNAPVYVTDCYSLGSAGGGSPVGGIVGDNEGTVSNCYSTQNAAIANGGTVANSYALGKDKTEQEMLSVDFATLLGDSFQSSCGGYPVLSWEQAVEHTWGEGVMTAEPTYHSEGVMTYTCSVCNATKTEAIPALKYGWYIDAGGATGTAYTISSERDLAELADIVNGTVPEVYGIAQDNFAGKTVTLANDIALAEDGLYTAVADVTYGSSGYPMTTTQYVLKEEAPIWTPIGSGTASGNTNATTANAFAGTFDGAGFTVSGVYTGTKDATAGNTDTVQGLFGVVSGTVKNVTVSGCITGKIVVGGVVAHLAGGTVENCVNNAVVFADGGQAPNSGVENGPKRGGAVGGIVGNAMTGSSVTGCVNNAHIVCANTSKGGRAAGIIGLIDGSNDTVAVSKNANTGNVEAYQYAAGIVGLQYSKNSTITECYNTGDITGYSSGSTYVGGIVSQCYADVSNCYNTGDITIINSGKAAHQGGIVSDFYGAKIENCYNTGNTAAGSSYGAICGTGYGSSSNNKLVNCYALDTNVGEDLNNGCVTTATAEEMAAPLFVAKVHGGSDAFNYDAAVGRPILAWEGGTSVFAVAIELGAHAATDADAISAVVAGEALADIVVASDNSRFVLAQPTVDPADAGITVTANADRSFKISGTPTASVTITFADAVASKLGEALEAADAAMEGVYVSDDGETAVVDGQTVEIPVGSKYVSTSTYEAMVEIMEAAQAICDDPASSDIDMSNAAWALRTATSTFKTAIDLAQIPVLDQAAADEVNAMIESLPAAADATATDAEAADAAKAAYDALTPAQKALVSEEAVAKMNDVKGAADLAAAAAAIELINALPEAGAVTAGDIAAAETAKAAYDALTEDQKALVSADVAAKAADVASAAEAAVEAKNAEDAQAAIDAAKAAAEQAAAKAACDAAGTAYDPTKSAADNIAAASKAAADKAAAAAKAETEKAAAAAEAARIDLSKATMTAAKATYTGKALTPKVTLTYGGKTLKEGTDYTLTYANNKNAGAGVAIATGKGAYTGVAFKSFTIAKAKNTMTAKAAKKTISAKAKTLAKKDVTIKKSKAFKVAKAKGTVTFTLGKVPSKLKGKIAITAKGKITLSKGVKKGTYKVKVKVAAAGNANYKAKSKTVTLKIKVK